MNADIQKIKKSRLFRKMPQVAFDRLLGRMQVRAFGKGESILRLQTESKFRDSFGYVVNGRAIFIASHNRPVGLALRDEFFVGRLFTLGDHAISEILSGHEQTLIVYIPKSLISALTAASREFSEILEEIYEAVFERARIIAADSRAKTQISDWMEAEQIDKTLNDWIQTIERKRIQALERRNKERRNATILRVLWLAGLGMAALAGLECYALWKHERIGILRYFFSKSTLGEFDPGSPFNITLGIIGFTLLVLTNVHTASRWLIKKFKIKINYQFSQQIHIWLGVIGSLFILLHTAFHLKGGNVAHLAVYGLAVVLFSGFVGQVLSNLIPKSIQGERLKLETIRADQGRLKQKAELMMPNEQLFKTSLQVLSIGEPKSFWMSIFLAPLIYFRAWNLKRQLRSAGVSRKQANVATRLLIQEKHLERTIRFLEVSGKFFRKWMAIHKPIGYVVYALATTHVIIETLLS